MTTDDESRIARDCTGLSHLAGQGAQSASERRADWRKALLGQRAQRSADPLAQEALLTRLQAVVESHLGGLPAMQGRVMGLYWPVRGEPSLGALPERWSAAGVQLALPVVQARHAPLQFVAWTPGDPMRVGDYGIARPAADRPVRPGVLIVPCVGFDRRGFRLGYGGGYYDRTFEQLADDGQTPAMAFGVAWDEGLIDDIEPLPTDVPMHAVITPSGVFPDRTHSPDGKRSTRSSA